MEGVCIGHDPKAAIVGNHLVSTNVKAMGLLGKARQDEAIFVCSLGSKTDEGAKIRGRFAILSTHSKVTVNR